MKHCNLCGRAVNGNEYRLFPHKRKPQSKGLVVCANCERSKPRCAVCQTPMTIDRAAFGFCADCAQEGLHCRSCGAHINGNLLMVDGNAGPYCDMCFRQFHQCNLCGVPIGKESVLYPDGRMVCAECHQTAITDPQVANALFEQVVDILEKSLCLPLVLRPRLALVDHLRLIELARTPAAQTGQDSERALGLFMRAGRKRIVYLQEFLPRSVFIQVVAHEFAHAWQGENCPLMDDATLREGFAEWAAYHVLLELDAKKEAEQMLARRDLYGQGLRHYVEIEAQRGPAGVLQSCRG